MAAKAAVRPLRTSQQHQKTKRRKYQQQTLRSGHRPSLMSSDSKCKFEVLVLCLVFLLLQLSSVDAETLSDGKTEFYYHGCYTARNDLLKELVYAKTPQTCLEICVHQNNIYAILETERCFCTNAINDKERQDEQLCNLRCMGDKSQYCGGVGVHSYYAIKRSNDQVPQNVRTVNATENSLTITWAPYNPPKIVLTNAEVSPVPIITNFLVKSQVLKTYSSLPFFPQPEFIVQSSEASFEITDLHPATMYNISVTAMCGKVVCGNASITGTTLVALPNPAPPQPHVIGSTDTTITVEIAPLKNDNGPVSKVLIIVERIDGSLSQPFEAALLGNWQKAQNDGVPYYIAAELDYLTPADNVTRQFVVGDDKRYGRYTNPPLDKNNAQDIHISLGVVSTLNGVTKTLYTRGTHEQHTTTMDNFTYATFDSGSESIIALSVTCAIFGTCLVLSLITYFYLRYKTSHARGGLRNRNGHEMTLQQPIIERENNGFVVEDELPSAENFKQQLDTLLDGLDKSKRLPRNSLRMNVNDIVAEGRYGEVITGKLLSTSLIEASSDCQLHVLELDDLASKDQAHLLQEFRNLTRLQQHEHILDFYGVSASADWLYFVFEHQTVSLKRRLIESRRAPSSTPVQRITTLSEELVLQWIYEVASAMEYLGRCKVVHKQICSHSIFMTPDSKLKVSVFGPIPFVNPNQKKIDIARWLAPEALRYEHYSSKSDVWSFACVAWECCALGGTPYANINNSQQLLDAIKSGSRPAQPAYVYQDLYQLLMNCWQLEPSERINFEDIAFNVRQLMTSARHALSFDRMPEAPGNNVLDTLPYYLPMLEMLN